jgi:GT2 family glycosyltransferase
VTGSIRAVVVRWRGGDEVRRCLRSLLDEGGSDLKRVVLVDSGSGDGGAQKLAAEFTEIEVIPLEENYGFAHAADRGASEGAEPHLLVLNPDTVVTRGAIGRLVALLADRPRAAGAVPLLEDMDGVSQHRWQLRHLPTTARLALGLPGRSVSAAAPTSPIEVPQPAAAAWLVRRAVWEDMGGLDPTFAPAWWEDVDFCSRLGHRLSEPEFPFEEGFVVQPAARLRHVGGASISALGQTAFFKAYYRNLLHYAARHHPGRLGQIRRGLIISLTGRMLFRPSKRQAYSAALDTIRMATPSARGGSPPATRARSEEARHDRSR